MLTPRETPVLWRLGSCRGRRPAVFSCREEALARFMQSLLFGVGGNDPLTFATVGLLLTGIAFVASYVPARRAARIDPMASLRAE